MFERLEPITPDGILALLAAYRADPDPRKVDLGIGVYRNERGETPILEAVRAAENALHAGQTTKAYVGPTGHAGFNSAMEQLVFGASHPVLASGRLRTVQAPGGCGALRLGAEIIRTASPHSVVHVPTPVFGVYKSPLTSTLPSIYRFPFVPTSPPLLLYVGVVLPDSKAEL